MMRLFIFTMIIIMSAVVIPCNAKDRLKLEATIIKGNKEMPQIVYIIPWKDLNEKHQAAQTLVLHSLFGDLFDPVSISTHHSDQYNLAK